MNRFRLAVLVTYHNERALLRECLNSLLCQTVTPDEIVVYDDASDAPASEYVPAGAPVRIIRGDVNRGPAYGRNILLAASRSDYIHFHDADDLFDSRWSKAVRQAILDGEPDAIFTEVSSYRDGQLECERVFGLKALQGGRDLVRFCIRGAILPAGGTYRRQIVMAIGGYRQELWQSEDFDFHVRLAASGIRYSVIDDPLVKIRIRPASRSQNQVEVWTSALHSIQMLAKELDPIYRSDLAEKAAQVGSMLYRAKAREEALAAFQTARELGPPTFQSERRFYRALARLAGPEAAERYGAIYRRLVSESGRRYFAARGW